MVRSEKEFIVDLKRDIERWKADLAKTVAAGATPLTVEVSKWIELGEKMVRDYEAMHHA